MNQLFLFCVVASTGLAQSSHETSSLASGFSPLASYSGILNEPAPDDSGGQAAPGDGAAQSAPKGTVAAAYKPYTAAQKFKSASRDTFGPVALVLDGFSAGINQITNTPSEWRQGMEGYGRRYASSFGTNLTHQYFGFALDAALHEDPRYFPSTDRRTTERVKSVVRQIFLARKDSGGEEFAVGRWGSAFGAGFATNIWMAKSQSQVGDGIRRGVYILGIEAGFHLAEEFIPILRHLSP